MQPIESIETGRQLALRMQRAFPRRDWVDDLVRGSGWDRNTVEWHLQEEMEPPRPILDAAARLLEGSGQERDVPDGDVAPDELPFSGLPGNLGKLKAD